MKRLVLFGMPLAIVATGAIFVLLLTATFYTYHRMTAEAPIAFLSFRRVGNQEFDATVHNGNTCTVGVYRLYGEQWRIDAQFLKWRPWAALVGLDSMYRLERLSGRYRHIRDENSKRHVAYALAEPSMIELSHLATSSFLGIFSPVDVVYGSSAYLDIDPASSNATVYKTQSGLVARKGRRPTDPDTTRTPKITDDAACNAKDSFWHRAAVKLESIIRSAP